MSKRGYISRYLCILRKLKLNHYSTFDEISNYIDQQTEYLQMRDDNLNIGFSLRTFQRDVKEISNIFGIDILYSKQGKGYYIDNDEAENMNFQRMIEAFDVFNSLQIAQDVRPFMFPENRKPQGTENIYGMLHAIKNKYVIEFKYQKFYDEIVSHRKVNPYSLKENKNRWYLIAKDHGDHKVKTFGLDRLKELKITDKKFEPDKSYNVAENFRYFFGILTPDDLKLEDIILSFEPFAGKYIKTLPLHETQEILIDNEEELRIKLKVYITYDFLMELLSHNNTLKIIKPQSLIDEIKNMHLMAFKQYS